jgi:large subunit ribosomal protein L4
MAVATYTKSGGKATTPTKLNKNVFGVDVKNHQLLKEAYVAYLANGRTNLAKTKKRGEVRGGGQKPWRQKGTGRARFGSSRNPIWEGGGVAFGPTGNENYARKLTLVSKRRALRQALTLAAKENLIKVIADFDSSEAKVKSTLNLLNKIEATGNILLVVDEKNEAVNRSTNNLGNVKAVSAKYLNVFDILNADCIVITTNALDVVSEWLGGSNE